MMKWFLVLDFSNYENFLHLSRTVHRVSTNSKRDVAADQYVHLVGFLNTSEFTNSDGKRRYDGRVRAVDVSVIEPCHKDVNSIELRGVVISDVISTDEFSMFRVLNTFVSK